MMGFTALNWQALRHGPERAMSNALPKTTCGAIGEICKAKANAGTDTPRPKKRWRWPALADKLT
jgi:hypothetical protein